MMDRESPADVAGLELGYVLEVYALWPDEYRTRTYVANVGTKQRLDCFVRRQL